MKIRTGGGIHLKGGVNAAAIEIYAADDGGAVLSESVRRVALKFEGKTGIELNAEGQPEARLDLIAEAAAHGVALVLGDREMAGGLAGGAGSIVAQEESTGDRVPSIAEHIGIAGEPGETMPIGDIKFPLESIDDGLTESDGKLMVVLEI